MTNNIPINIKSLKNKLVRHLAAFLSFFCLVALNKYKAAPSLTLTPALRPEAGVFLLILNLYIK